MRHRLIAAILISLLGVSLLPRSAAAAGSDCSLALVFALDISVSVDETEYRLQREGLAAALNDPEVSALILQQPDAVAMLVFEWSSHRHQSVKVPWHMIETRTDLSRFTASLIDYPGFPHFYPTGVGRAVAFGLTALAEQSQCTRRVLDVSGDGVNNDGYAPDNAYRHFPVDGVTVNGLVILGADADVLSYYLDNVRFGPGAFVEVAGSFAQYEQAMKRKLLREIGVRQFVSNEGSVSTR
ncbi:DUF1194 domain-containing protein [Sedimentitalea sp. JM2-8]|uniref:DUF1194 domain-containing protein n=1 Tax=Sedimentitalea xiamensis TaxID=3050037 RepID=A0ABT7FAJ4_9RHOB|nr:DUF1194 domain-containing protein [Sedimentitalea xiamensis]MDK3072124.1 DUF1194 domain-containing protein [Sedimentitalea xiamensis]